MAIDRFAWLLDGIGGIENLPPELPPQDDEDEEPEEFDYADVYNSEEFKNLPPPTHGIDTNFTLPLKKQPPPPTRRQPAAPAPQHVYGHTYAFGEGKGERAPLGIDFCPFIGGITKFPYKFVPTQWKQPIANTFIDAEKAYQRDWDLYYINSDYSGLVTFVPLYQLQALIEDINEHFPDANIAIDEYSINRGLVINFDDVPEHLRPRYVGCLQSKPQYDSWKFQLESDEMGKSKILIAPEGDRSFEAFRQKMDLAAEAAKSKAKAQKAVKHQQVIVQRQDMARQSLRGQRYLGLHPKKVESAMPDMNSLTIEAIDPTKPVPHPFDSEPVFIAIDCEAYEFAPKPVTEVGVAVLDTRDLKDIPPGEKAENWFQYIRARHYRIIEYKDYRNGTWVPDCADKFEFGKSEFVSKNKIGQVLSKCFKPPFCGPEPPPTSTIIEDSDFPPLGTHGPISPSPPPPTEPEEERNIILVGHDINADIEYCKRIGFAIYNRRNIIDQEDTAILWRTYTQSPQPSALGKVLQALEITGWFLHNAGNDAVYTLQAMLAILVKAASERGDEEAEKRGGEWRERKLEERMEDVREMARMDAEGWEVREGEDGGQGRGPKESGAVVGAAAGKKVGGSAAGYRGGLFTEGGAPLDV